MTIPRKGRWLLAVPLAVALLTTFTPTPAQADPPPQDNPQISFSRGPSTGGQAGSWFYMAQSEFGCPAVPEGVAYQEVRAKLTDAAGVVTDYGSVVRTNADGSWPDSKWMQIPYRTVFADVDPPVIGQDAAPGWASIDAQCVLSDGTVTQNYWPNAFGVGVDWAGAPSWPFQVMTPTVEPGGTIQLESNNEDSADYKYRCWTGVEGAIIGHGYTVPFTGTVYGGGTWAASVVASAETPDTMVPLPAGKYTVRAHCKEQYHPGEYAFTYADQIVTVGNSTPPPTATCKDVIFIGIAGSGQQFDGPRNVSISPEVQTAYDGFKKVLNKDKTVRVRMINYPAYPVDMITKQLKLNTYLNGKNAGVNRLRALVSEVRQDCPGQAIVIAGYSQGALVAHEYLIERARTTTGAEKQAITAVVTVADPAQIQYSPVLNFGTADSSAIGICQYMAGSGADCFKDEALGDIPQVYKNRTTTVCKTEDIVCDTARLVNGTFPVPGLAYNAGIMNHTSYNANPEVELAGKRAARQVNNRLN